MYEHIYFTENGYREPANLVEWATLNKIYKKEFADITYIGNYMADDGISVFALFKVQQQNRVSYTYYCIKIG